jgi:hypothetical protein
MPAPLRIAMWSGPRNISTAMMRAWGNRPDAWVVDEPFYACYLRATGKPHPGAAEVIARHEPDWRKVVARLTGETAAGKSIHYQKHMTHHLLEAIDRAWLDRVANCFLIRDPREVIVSYIAKNDIPALEDLGFTRQLEIFELVRGRTGRVPPVLDARDVLENPRRSLGLLCDALGVPFLDAMLAWPPGPRPTDGVWAKHWYKEVLDSTSFRPYRPRSDPVPDALAPVHDRCRECYDILHDLRLR